MSFRNDWCDHVGATGHRSKAHHDPDASPFTRIRNQSGEAEVSARLIVNRATTSWLRSNEKLIRDQDGGRPQILGTRSRN